MNKLSKVMRSAFITNVEGKQVLTMPRWLKIALSVLLITGIVIGTYLLIEDSKKNVRKAKEKEALNRQIEMVNILNQAMTIEVDGKRVSIFQQIKATDEYLNNRIGDVASSTLQVLIDLDRRIEVLESDS